MSNPVFSNNDVFGEPRRRGGAAVQPRPYEAAGAGAAGQAAATGPSLEQMYSAPSATTRDTGRMTYDDVIMKTGGLLAVVVVVGALTWLFAPGLFFVGAIVGLVLGLVNAFKREPSPALITAYAVAQGVFLGGISAFFEAAWPGVVMQAVLATGATFVACLVLFRSGKVRVTPKFTRWLLVAVGGYLVFSLVNLGLVWFGGYNMRTDVTVMGIPLGVIVGIVAVGLAAAMLILDFDSIKRGVEQGAPARYAWTAAFGLLVTIVWMYLEFLRLLSILRGGD